MELLRSMNFIELLFFVLLPGGALICTIMFAWDQVKRYEDEIEYLKQKNKMVQDNSDFRPRYKRNHKEEYLLWEEE